MKTKATLIALMLLLAAICAACSPKDYAAADVMRMQAQPTATAAALANAAAGIRVTIVAPVQAAAEAKSIMARTDQQIAEDKQQQTLRHIGEINALMISNTERLQVMAEQHEQNLKSIDAQGAVVVASAQAEAVKASSAAVRDAGVNLAVAIGMLILLTGVSVGVAMYAGNRAAIFYDEQGRMVLVKGNTILLPSRSSGPAIIVRNPSAPERLAAGVRLLLGKPVALNPDVLLPTGPNQAEVTQRDQTIDLIRAALADGKANPQIQRAATDAVTQVFGGSMTNLLGGRLPEQTILIDAPEQVRAFENSIGGDE